MGKKRYPELIAHLNTPFQILIKTFVKRLDSGKNCLVAVVGQTGSGKSLATVCILYWTYIYMHGEAPTLEDSRKHWFFKAKDFLQRMNDPTLKKKELNMWDEMGVSASHKAHASVQNRAIGWLVQTFRNLEQMVIFTVPTLAYVDKTVRNLLHYQLEVRTVLMTEKVCIIKPLEIQYNIRMDKTYYHNLFWKAEDGSGFMDEVDVVGIPLAPPEFVKAYDEDSGNFKSELNKRIQGMLEKAEDKEKKESLSGEESIIAHLTGEQKKVWNLVTLGITEAKELHEKFGIKKTTAYNILHALRAKGLDLEKFSKKENLKIQNPEIPKNTPATN